jgi:hypothetical protein
MKEKREPLKKEDLKVDCGQERVCAIPHPKAVLCKACEGKGKNFPMGAKHEVTKKNARKRIGCTEIVT